MERKREEGREGGRERERERERERKRESQTILVSKTPIKKITCMNTWKICHLKRLHQSLYM